MSPEKEQKGKRSRPAGASKGQRAGKTPQERSKLRSMLEYEGVTRSKGAKKSEAPAEKKAGRAQPRGGGKSRLRAIFEYEGVTRQEALTKEALRESEQKLRVILDSLAAGITITDLEGNIIEMNRGALRLHGFSSKEEVIGRNGLELIADKDRARAIENWTTRFEDDSAKTASDHYTLLKADGSQFEAAVSESLLRDKYGEPEGFITIARDITERKRAEELVRASEAKLRAMFESIEDAVTIVDLEGNILEVNDVMCRMSGYSREELIGKSGFDIIGPEHREAIVNDLMKQLKGETPKEAPTYQFSTPDGREYYAELHISVIRDGTGRATGFLSIHSDVTERKRMQEALRESEEMARGMLQSAATGIYLVQDRVFQYVSPLFEEISGYASNELIGTNPLEYVHPEDRESVRRKAIENLKGRSSLPHEFRFMKKDSQPVWVLEKVASIEYGGMRAAIASFMDITEQKKAEAELEKSAEKLRIIIESIGDMLFVTDLELNFVNVNDAAVRLLGYSREEELIGRSAVDCIAEKDRSRVAVDMGKALAMQSGVETIEYTLLTADGKEVDAESNIDILRDCSGMVVGLIITARDVTERKRMQEAVRASEEKLRIMFDSAKDGIVLTDAMGNVQQMNDAVISMIGYSREELTGMNALEFIAKDDQQIIADAMSSTLDSRQAMTDSIRLTAVRKDGSQFYTEIGTGIILDKQGNVDGFLAIMRDVTERQRMEAELEKSAEKLRLVIESIGDMLFITDLDLNFSNVNEAAVRQLGYSTQEELAGRNAVESVAEADRNRVAIELGRALAEERGIEVIEYSLQAADGRRFDVEANAEILRDCSGKVVGLIISARDVTERKHMQEAIRNSEEKLRGIFDTIPDGVTFTDMTGVILDLNQAMVRMYGFNNKEELLGRNAIDFVAPEYHERVILLGMQAIKDEHNIESIEYRLVDAAGQEFDAEFFSAPLRDSSGEPVAWVNVSRDITERKQAERAVRESEKKFRTIFESILDGLTVTDLSGNIVDMNDAALQLHGYGDKQELIGKSTIEYMVAESDRKRTVEDALEAIKQDRPLSRAEYRLQRGDGTEFDGEFSTAVLRDDEGKPTGHIGMTRDITERKRAEEAIRQSEEKLHIMFESMRDAIVLTDTTGTIVEVNDAAVRMHGYSSRDEIIGKNGIELVAESDRKKVAEEAIKQSKGGISEGVVETHMLLRVDGTEFESESSRAILRDAGGRTTGFISVERDITERRRMEEQLRDTAQKLRTMFDSMNDAATIVDMTTKIVDVNEAAVRLHQYASREQMIGMPGADLIAERDRESVVKYTMKAVEKGTTHERKECTLLKADGTEFDAEISFSPLYDKVGNLESFLTLSQDITERKRAAQALEESESRFRALFENMSSAVAVYEVKNKARDFIVKDMNSAGEKISKLKKEDIIGKNLLDVFPNMKQSGLFKAMQRAWKTGKAEHVPPTLYQDDRISGWRENYIYKLPTGEVVAVYDDVTERIQAEEALRQSEEKLRLTFENMGDGITVTDLEGKIIEVNDVQLRMSGYSRDEFIGRDGWDIISYVDRDRVIDDVMKSIKGEAPEEGPHYRFVNKDGSEYDAELRASVLRDSSGEPIGFITTVRDITERRRAEEAIRESEEKLRLMFESTSDGIIITDTALTITDTNEAAPLLLGFESKEELIGQSAIPFMSAEEGTGSDTHTEFSVSQLRDVDGNTIGFIGICRDITERMQAEEAIRESEEKLRTMFQSTSDGILVTDQALRIVEANEAAARMLGFGSKEEMAGQSALQYMSTESRTGGEENGDGKVQIEFSISQLRDSAGNTTGFIGVARDVTERRKAEAQMKRMLEDLARSNAELEQFAYIASHDLQEPLRMISSYTQLIAKRYRDKLDADGVEFIEYAVDGASRMQERIQSLLTYSRVGTRGKEFEPVNCEDVIEQTLSNMQVPIKRSGATITHDPLPTVIADDTQMLQLFQNLIENGIKFHSDKPPEIHISAKEQDEDWLFSFSDNGIGIDPQYNDRIFVIFKRLHAKGEYAGTGVGLALCKKIVERHGGRIWVESEPDKGATFCFTIPKEIKEED